MPVSRRGLSHAPAARGQEEPVPLAICVSLSKKSSRNYQSRGVALSLTSELDPALLSRPGDLQAQIDALYMQVAAAVDRQLAAPPDTLGLADRRLVGHQPTPLTAWQRRWVLALTHRLGIDADEQARQLAGVPLDDLSFAQAAALIARLKALVTPTPAPAIG
jgi:hypothetical protein